MPDDGNYDQDFEEIPAEDIEDFDNNTEGDVTVTEVADNDK